MRRKTLTILYKTRRKTTLVHEMVTTAFLLPLEGMKRKKRDNATARER
jgi:hypothetical protein